MKYAKLLFLLLLFISSFTSRVAASSGIKNIDSLRFGNISTCIKKNNQYYLCEFTSDKNIKITSDRCIKIKKRVFDFLRKSSGKELLNQLDGGGMKASSPHLDSVGPPPGGKMDPGGHSPGGS